MAKRVSTIPQDFFPFRIVRKKKKTYEVSYLQGTKSMNIRTGIFDEIHLDEISEAMMKPFMIHDDVIIDAGRVRIYQTENIPEQFTCVASPMAYRFQVPTTGDVTLDRHIPRIAGGFANVPYVNPKEYTDHFLIDIAGFKNVLSINTEDLENTGRWTVSYVVNGMTFYAKIHLQRIMSVTKVDDTFVGEDPETKKARIIGENREEAAVLMEKFRQAYDVVTIGKFHVRKDLVKRIHHHASVKETLVVTLNDPNGLDHEHRVVLKVVASENQSERFVEEFGDLYEPWVETAQPVSADDTSDAVASGTKLKTALAVGALAASLT